MEGNLGWLLHGNRLAYNNRSVACTETYIEWCDRFADIAWKNDPTRFVGDCTCTIGTVVRDSVDSERILIAGESDCTVHGFGSEDTKDHADR